MAVVKVKNTRSAVVSVSCRKIDSREREARELVEWLKTIPSKNLCDPLIAHLTLNNDWDAVQKLVHLADNNFDIRKFDFDLDFLRVFSDKGQKQFSGTYMEYFPATDGDYEHYSPLCTQNYTHVVDAFKSIKARFESILPEDPAQV